MCINKCTLAHGLFLHQTGYKKLLRCGTLATRWPTRRHVAHATRDNENTSSTCADAVGPCTLAGPHRRRRRAGHSAAALRFRPPCACAVPASASVRPAPFHSCGCVEVVNGRRARVHSTSSCWTISCCFSSRRSVGILKSFRFSEYIFTSQSRSRARTASANAGTLSASRPVRTAPARGCAGGVRGAELGLTRLSSLRQLAAAVSHDAGHQRSVDAAGWRTIARFADAVHQAARPAVAASQTVRHHACWTARHHLWPQDSCCCCSAVC